ncbi:MAG TPA: ferritin-like domain-containing protein [Flavisolibacter sp.]|jgi:rubrerythrin|nr:ferritin-like domain-containing protein [Flavisolibacter sp.]
MPTSSSKETPVIPIRPFAGNLKTLSHPQLVDLLKKAYSAEKAAAFAYQGHAAAVKDNEQKASIRQIELDEWNHRKEVLALMQEYQIPVSRWYEIKFHIIGKLISFSCHVIGWFMPFYFAGRLESGNVCEYFRMKQLFHALGIRKHDVLLYEMGMKEKEHEVYFLEKIRNNKLLPFFEKWFFWGKKNSFNNIDLDKKYPVEASDVYCNRKD